jgi:hypothetical protein
MILTVDFARFRIAAVDANYKSQAHAVGHEDYCDAAC